MIRTTDVSMCEFHECVKQAEVMQWDGTQFHFFCRDHHAKWIISQTEIELPQSRIDTLEYICTHSQHGNT